MSKILPLQHVISIKIVNETIYIFFILSLWNPVLYTYGASQFRLATFQGPHGHAW